MRAFWTANGEHQTATRPPSKSVLLGCSLMSRTACGWACTSARVRSRWCLQANATSQGEAAARRRTGLAAGGLERAALISKPLVNLALIPYRCGAFAFRGGRDELTPSRSYKRAALEHALEGGMLARCRSHVKRLVQVPGDFRCREWTDSDMHSPEHGWPTLILGRSRHVRINGSHASGWGRRSAPALPCAGRGRG